MLNGEDQDAFIADANLERRDLSKGQKAMLVAVRFPQVKTFPGKKSEAAKDLVSKTISGARVSQARTVLEHCVQYVPLVIDGSMGLDEAYRDANRKRASHATDVTQFLMAVPHKRREQSQHFIRFDTKFSGEHRSDACGPVQPRIATAPRSVEQSALCVYERDQRARLHPIAASPTMRTTGCSPASFVP